MSGKGCGLSLWHSLDLPVFSSDTEIHFLDLSLSISNSIISSQHYDNRDDFDFIIIA